MNAIVDRVKTAAAAEHAAAALRRQEEQAAADVEAGKARRAALAAENTARLAAAAEARARAYRELEEQIEAQPMRGGVGLRRPTIDPPWMSRHTSWSPSKSAWSAVAGQADGWERMMQTAKADEEKRAERLRRRTELDEAEATAARARREQALLDQDERVWQDAEATAARRAAASAAHAKAAAEREERAKRAWAAMEETVARDTEVVTARRAATRAAEPPRARMVGVAVLATYSTG